MHFKSRLKQTSDLLSLNNGFPFIIIDVLKTSSLFFLYTIHTILVMKYLINDSCNYKISNEMFIPQKKWFQELEKNNCHLKGQTEEKFKFDWWLYSFMGYLLAKSLDFRNLFDTHTHTHSVLAGLSDWVFWQRQVEIMLLNKKFCLELVPIHEI